MKALIFRETGEPKSVLQLAEVPTPTLGPGEALVRVLLTPIHPSDLHMVRGRYGYQPELPASPGIEAVGIVEAVGPGVRGPNVGTRVVFVRTWNTWREQIVCPVDRLVPVPDGLDNPTAAISYTNPLTAWALTISSHSLNEGDWLLQTAPHPASESWCCNWRSSIDSRPSTSSGGASRKQSYATSAAMR